MEYCNIAVFKEIRINGLPMFLWFRAGQEGEDHLVVDEIITEEELHARLAYD